MSFINDQQSADIEYAGSKSSTRSCKDAVLRLLQYGDKISHVLIVSNAQTHCLVMHVNNTDVVAVRSGFRSGYPGEGPRTFSEILAILDERDIDIEEINVSPTTIEQIDSSNLSQANLDEICSTKPIRPVRWNDYIFEKHWKLARKGKLSSRFPLTIPFAVIDSRIMDLAQSFWDDPDARLIDGYRRLESNVRSKAELDEVGAKLIQQAFAVRGGKLGWEGVKNAGERDGRASVISGAFKAYRNRRAHRSVDDDREDLLSEFLLLNHLHRMERTAIESDLEDDD